VLIFWLKHFIGGEHQVVDVSAQL